MTDLELVKCVYCGADENLTIDHIDPFSKSQNCDAENLVTACRKCNSSKHNHPVEEWLAKKKEREAVG